MRKLSGIIVILLFSMSFLSAQSSSDFALRVENIFQKLYENPEVSIHAAKEIREPGQQWTVNDILAEAYLRQGNYLESVRITFEKSEVQNPEQSLRQSLMIAREFYQLNLYEQTAEMLSPFTAKNTNNFKNSKADPLLSARIFQLEAENFIALKELNQAEKSLAQSSAFAKQSGKSADLISYENVLFAATVLAEKGQSSKASKMADGLLLDLNKMPRAVYLRAKTQQLRAYLFFKEQKYDVAIKCLQEALTHLANTNFQPLRSGIYQDLMRYYLVGKNDAEFELYKLKYSESSKALNENKKEARRELIQLHTKYLAEKSDLWNTEKKQQFLYLLGIGSLLLLTAGSLFIREMQKAKNLTRQIRFFRSIKTVPGNDTGPVKEKELFKKTLLIPKETEKEILAGLV